MIKVLAFPAGKNKASNPYNYLLYSGIEKQNIDVKEFSFKRCLGLDYQLIHIHWPEFYLNSNYWIKAFTFTAIFLFCLLFSKFFGKKVVWTIHNLKPHSIKYKYLNRIFWRLYRPLVDGVISLSKANEKLFFSGYKLRDKVVSAIVYHGLYNEYYENKVSKEEAKKHFLIDESKKVCLFIGQVKAYKNVEVLVELFNEESVLNDTVLIIAGKFETEEYYEQVKALAQDNENIIIHNKFISDTDLQYYFNASELCLLPFKDVFNSGSVLLSASFNTPVLVPMSNNFLEYKKLLQPHSVNTYQGFLEVAQICNILKKQTFKPNNEEDCFQCRNDNIKILSWPEIKASLSNFYSILLQDKV